MTAGADQGGFVHYMEKVEGRKIRDRSDKFKDFFSQARMFWISLTEPEQDRLVAAGRFELGKVGTMAVRERMIHQFFNRIDHGLARRVAEGIGVDPPTRDESVETRYTAPEVSVERQARRDLIETRKVAILLDEGFDGEQLSAVRQALEDKGARPMVVAERYGAMRSASGDEVEVDVTFINTDAVLWDAVFVPGGKAAVQSMQQKGDVLAFLHQTFKHYKPVGALGEAVDLLRRAQWQGVDLAGGGEGDDGVVSSRGVVTGEAGANGSFVEAFIRSIGHQRHWDRDVAGVPA